MRRRTIGIIAIGVLLSTSFGACAKKQAVADDVRRFMAATAALPRAYVYTERAGAVETVVKGAVADDFRYKALTAINGAPAFDEIVIDDAVADRVLNQDGLAVYQRKTDDPSKGSGSQVAGTSGSVAVTNDASVIEALNATRYVLDPVGAPTLLPAANDKRRLGDDPTFDSLTVFKYVDQAMNEAARVIKFNRDSLEYKPREDPFPTPKPGSGVDRYDLVRRPVPKQQDQASGGNNAVPSAGAFRKLSVYVKNGLVIQVLEQMDVARRLADLSRNYSIKFGGVNTQQAVDLAMKAINAVRVGQGLDEIRVRTMSYQLVDVGKAEQVELPSEAIKGSLSVFENRGKTLRKASNA